MSYEQKCTSCGKVYDNQTNGGRTWWNCRGYHNITGFFCSDCYGMISHDPYGKPHDPEGYLFMLIKLGQAA